MNAILRVSDKIINSDCRVESILENTIRGLDEAALAAAGTITYATNVKEICTQVAEAAVDCKSSARRARTASGV